MASNRMSGNTIGLEINGEFVSCETSCEFSFEADLRPASPVLSGRWKEFVAGVRSWSVNLNAAMLLRMLDGASVDTVLNAFLTGATMGIRFMVKDPALPNFIISGNVMVQNGSISAQVNTLAGWTVLLTGNGPFTIEVNTNLVYVLATDDVGDVLVQDGNNNLIIGAPGTGLDVVVTYNVVHGVNPSVLNTLIINKNGVDAATLFAEGSGILPAGTFVEGDTLVAYQIAYPTFRWAPGSQALLVVKVDGVTLYSMAVTSQTAISLQNSPAFVIPVGVSLIEISSIGSNESLNYITEVIQTNNNLAVNEVEIDVTDNVEAGLGLTDLRPGNGTGYYAFNVKGTTGALTVVIQNLKITNITYTLVGEGGYLQTGTILASSSVTHNDVTKGGIVVDTSNI